METDQRVKTTLSTIVNVKQDVGTKEGRNV